VLARRPDRAVALAQDVGALLARFHRRCARASWPGADAEHDAFEALVRDWHRFGPALGLSASDMRQVDEVAGRARAWLAREPTLIDERCGLGWRRSGHGDLHADNLLLWRGKPVLLDVLPQARYRVCDVTADVGRLAYELHRIAGPAVREAMLQAYERTSAPVPRGLVDYFECKSLLVDLAVLGAKRIGGRPWPARAPQLLIDLASICGSILTLA
jgi:aminoglycoside phosphotransferase family enzyme